MSWDTILVYIMLTAIIAEIIYILPLIVILLNMGIHMILWGAVRGLSMRLMNAKQDGFLKRIARK